MNEKYLTYNTVEFAQDEAFIRWVKEGGRSREWEEWLARHPEKQKEAEDARLLVQSIIIREAPASQARIETLWNKIDAATEENAKPATAPRLKAYRWLGYAAAAALAILLAFFFLRPDGPVSIKAGYGQVAEHTLPDGSKVVLNAGTTIRYQEDTWESARQASLEGEAFFEVEKGKPFVVTTPKGQVKVLGTSFNINTFEGRFDVYCYTGRVEVEAGGNRDTLSAGERALWNNGGWEKGAFESGGSPGWQRGRFEYHSAPLSDVFREMERQFDITIDAPDSILSRTYTGAYERNNLDSALYRVCWPMKLEAGRKGSVVTIREKTASPQLPPRAGE